MASFNECIFIGNITRDPRVSVSKNGKEYSCFSIAVPRLYDKEKVDFINCVAFGTICTAFIKPFLKKGNLVMVRGCLELGPYEKDGEQKLSMAIRVEKLQLLNSYNSATETTDAENTTVEPIDDDSLPF